MGPKNRKVSGGGRQGSPSHHEEEISHGDLSLPPFNPSVRHPSSHSASYSQRGTDYYPHPRSNYSPSVDENYVRSPAIRQPVKAKAPSLSGDREDNDSTTSSILGDPHIEISPNINVEVRVSVAAKQLAFQISESTKFWTTFQNEYNEEVAAITSYVQSGILEEIWRARTEYDGKGMSDEERQDFEQFDIHRMKLEACLDQLNKATKALTRSRASGDRSSHDSQQLSLKKIRVAGSLVLRLAAKVVSNHAACPDLIAEASRLEKLVDPKGPDARMLHQFDTLEISKEPKGESEKQSKLAETNPPFNPFDEEMAEVEEDS
ncbi:hypothetical protein GGS26DRAFT_562851 [Hypomontagnella submonticulosa]|nr:hypothetical protein GGS26DRAFT_562851 [Hypomontagnella submonticulosa]